VDLNTELQKLTSEQLHNIVVQAIDSLYEEIKDLSLSEEIRAEIIQIAKVCTKFGIINQPTKLKSIEDNSSSNKKLMLYTARWLKRLVTHRNQSYILREAPPLKDRDVIRDPALEFVLKRYYEENKIDITSEEIDLAINSHDLLMSIENIQGHLLEAYIAENICKEPYNFMWLEGEVVKAVDFGLHIPASNAQPDKEDYIYLLQIKNKYNTENSSSSVVRNVAVKKIEKWNRLSKKKQKGINVPVYNWNDLNKIIENFTENSPNLSEEGYLLFLENVLRTNPKIINI